MKVRMNSTRRGSPDGIAVHEYYKGESYDLPESLAQVFVEEKWASPVSDKAEAKAQPKAESKAKNPETDEPAGDE